MLGSLKKPLSVIGISETWLIDCTAELVNITGDNFVSNHRKSKTGGGVGIYLQNDLPKASKLTELLLFADDTSIFFLHSNPNYLENVLNNELLNIDVWLRCNKLSVNIKKTNYVTFSPSQRKLNHSFSLSFGGQPLIQSNVTKFLGVYLDEHLT